MSKIQKNQNNNQNTINIQNTPSLSPSTSQIISNSLTSNNINLNNRKLNNSENDLQLIQEAPPLETLSYSKNKYHFYINNPEKNINELNHQNNIIKTTKYNIITFLPKALLFQFMRLANIYFLIIAIIQCIPIISPLGPLSAVFPLIIVLSVSLIREGYEDYQRSKLDKEQNSDIIEVYDNNGFWKKEKSGLLNMGDMVKIYKDFSFPADLVLIDSDLNNGICYIETGTLDGEKNLKIKNSLEFTKGKLNKLNDIYIENIKKNENNNNKIVNSLKIKSKKSNENINKSDSSDNRSHMKLEMTDRFKYQNNKNNDNKNDKEKILIEGICECDLPNPNLYQLNGKMNMKLNNIGNEFPLHPKNLLLKGAKLRNTNWIIGIVIYTGHNCKIMKNAKEQVIKFSSVELKMNKLLIFILILQIILSIIGAFFHYSYFKKNKKSIIQTKTIKNKNDFIRNSFIDFMIFKIGIDSFLSFFTYFLLLNTLIPISLIITLEIVKMVQGLFIGFDIEGYSNQRKKFIKPNSVSLNEELGLVNYIFTDKTGTLTCNKMLLKFCVIGDICYEFIRDDFFINKELRDKEDIKTFSNYDMVKASSLYNKKNIILSSTYDNYIVSSLENKNICIHLDKTEKIIEEFWKALSLCHDCSIQDGNYVGMSPDNIELVKSAKLQGFSFDKSDNSSQINLNLGENGEMTKIFEKLCQIEFTSDRKRESIIIKEEGLYKLYIKGADSIIEERLNNSTPKSILDKAKYYVNLFSDKGYRTLYIAMRILTKNEYEEFAYNLEQAQMDIKHKKEKEEECYNQIEKNLTLIGATIVEDKLQDQVPEVIKDLRIAGIKIWMLTGDKLKTAYNIALSCNLISKNMKIFFIEGKDIKKNKDLEDINKNKREEIILSFIKNFNKYKNEFNSLNPNFNFSILLDEKALLTICDNIEISNIFLSVAKDAMSVICCRVSPLQKSQVVKLVKNYDKNKITLSIGDGGNDVSMILEAHIGIGIYGEEGLRAAQNSNYAIGEFKILKRLIFFHGYINLMRNSDMIIYFFYKNFVFTIIHFFYGFHNNFSGQTIIDDWFIANSNLLFTSIPLAVKGIIDIDLQINDGIIVSLFLPFLYMENRDKPIFTFLNFSLSLFKGIIHAIINFYFSYGIIFSSIDNQGNLADLWFCSVNLFTNMIIIVTIDLIVFTLYHTWINLILIIITSCFLYIIFLILVHNFHFFNSAGTMVVSFNSLKMWLGFLLIGGVCFISDYIILVYKTLFKNSIRNKIKLIKDKNDINQIDDDLKKLISNDNEINETERKLINNNSENDYSNGPIVLKKKEQNDLLNLNINNVEVLQKKNKTLIE